MTIREQIEKREQEILSPFACLSINQEAGTMMSHSAISGLFFSGIRDRILHSKAFSV